MTIEVYLLIALIWAAVGWTLIDMNNTWSEVLKSLDDQSLDDKTKWRLAFSARLMGCAIAGIAWPISLPLRVFVELRKVGK